MCRRLELRDICYRQLSNSLVSIGAILQHQKGTVTFTVGEEVYSLDLSSPTNRNVSKGDVFNGTSDLSVTCSPEVMSKMISKEVQPQQGV